MTIPTSTSARQQQEWQFFTGKLLLRVMILLGLASAAVNLFYYSSVNRHELSLQLHDDDGPSNIDETNSDNNNKQEAIAVVDDKDSKNNKKNKKGKVKKTFDGDYAGGQLVKRDAKGRVVVNAITALSGKELGVEDTGDEEINSAITLEEASVGREPILEILKEAGIKEFDAATVARLPTWEKIEKLYGKGPVVYGLDTCEAFRKSIPPEEASVASAGIFNSGTNTLAMYLNANCIMPENKKERYGGIRWQPPWGKHMVAKRKWTNTVKNDKKVNKTTVMPVAMIRDPYSWLQSMCKHPYAAKWHHSGKHCPNMVPNQDDLELFPYLEDNIPVQILYPEKAEIWDSLAHLWSDWYRQYFDADYPRLIVRFEDLLFHAKEMVTTICECAGGVPREPGKFAYVVDSGKFGKGHASSEPKTNMISAMVKYGTDKNRFNGMTSDDLIYANEHLDAEMMSIFQYEIPPPPS